MSNDVYGRTVSMSTDGTTDTYTVGGALEFQLPAGTAQAAAYVAFAKQGKLAQFQAALQEFILQHYALETRWNFIALYVDAQQNILLINRRAYIEQIFTWSRLIMTYAATFSATVNGSSDATAIGAMAWDFGTLGAADPLISPLAAVGIAN